MCRTFDTPLIALGNDIHFIQQALATAYFVYHKQDVANIHNDAALVVGQILDVATDSLPVTIEVETDQFAIGIMTGLPELPPVVCVVAQKATGMRPLRSA